MVVLYSDGYPGTMPSFVVILGYLPEYQTWLLWSCSARIGTRVPDLIVLVILSSDRYPSIRPGFSGYFRVGTGVYICTLLNTTVLCFVSCIFSCVRTVQSKVITLPVAVDLLASWLVPPPPSPWRLHLRPSPLACLHSPPSPPLALFFFLTSLLQFWC